MRYTLCGLRATAPIWIAAWVFLAAPTWSEVRAIGTSAVRLVWDSATGPVAEYAVYASTDGLTYELAALTRVPRVSLSAAPGEIVEVRVAARDASGREGPLSESSPPVVLGSEPLEIVRADVNGDARADFVWRDLLSDGVLLFSNGPAGLERLGAPDLRDAHWRLVGFLDVDFDGIADLLWHDLATGDVDLALLGPDGASAEVVPLGRAPEDWGAVGAGDVDGDGFAELIWIDSENALYRWELADSGVLAQSFIRQATEGWIAHALADMNGNGTDDVVWSHPAKGRVRYWDLSEGVLGVRLPDVASEWELLSVADYDGDGGRDLLWHHRFDARLALWLLEGDVVTGRRSLPSRPVGWLLAAERDFALDGDMDLLFRTPDGAGVVWDLEAGAFSAERLVIAPAAQSSRN